MKINKIYISAFGKLKDYTLDFKDGLNIVYGKNENGKSTVMAFIKMMFYGSGRGTSQISKNPRLKYTPWSGDRAAGRIFFEHNNINYCLERQFFKSDNTDKIQLINTDTGESKTVGSAVGAVFFGLSAAAFERTVFIGQLGAISKDEDANGEINSKDTVLLMQHIGVHSKEDKPEEEQPSQSTEPLTEEEPTSESASETEEPGNTQPAEEEKEPAINADFVTSGKSENTAFLTSESGANYVARIGNSWQSADGKYMYQIDFTIKNNSQKTIYNTSAKVNLSGGVNVEKNWDCSAKNETGVITVTTKNEGRLLPGGTFTCGFVISASSPITIESVTK